jgi:hypothetical protein
MAQRSQLLPKERVPLALNHEEADRVPLDFAATTFTSISVEAQRRLDQAVDFQTKESLFREIFQTCIDGEEIQRVLHIDFPVVSLEDNGGFRLRSLFRIFWYLRGMEGFLVDFVVNKNLAKLLMSKVSHLIEDLIDCSMEILDPWQIS